MNEQTYLNPWRTGRADDPSRAFLAFPEAKSNPLRSRLAGWLEDALANEEPPEAAAALLAELDGDEGAWRAAPGDVDQHALWSAMVALTQEIKLQGRTFKQLTERLESAGSPALATDDALAQARREADTEVRAEMLRVMVDLHERLHRGQAASSECLAHMDATADGREAAEALAKGYMLAIRRLEDVLRANGVRAMECVRCPFDPERMEAVDVTITDEVPEGEVLEVYRMGYEWNGGVFVTAQVRVSRNLKN